MRALILAGLLLAGCATPSAVIGALPDEHHEPDLVTVKHTVAAGQTLYRISRAYGITVEELMAANGLDDPKELKIGQELWVPGAAVVAPVATDDAPEPVAPKRTLPPPPPKRAAAVVGRKDGSLQWPVRGVLYGRFGRKGNEPHDGIDLAAPAGTPVKTAGEGKVLFAGEQKGYGLIVIIEHPTGLITLYAHNRDLRVKAGQAVRPGQVVATVGDSGATSGPHLHFEVRQDGKPVDPLDHLGPVP